MTGEGAGVVEVQTFSEAIVDAAMSIRPEVLRPDLRARAKDCVLDWVGCTIAGSIEDAAIAARKLGAVAGDASTATIIGSKARGGPLTAAFANGVASHALDFDDSSRWASAHASGPILSALLALAEVRGSSGSEVLEAIVAGLQGQCVLAIATGPGPYALGFHTTGTMGTFGATLATSHLVGLDRESRLRALSLAATQASGLKVVFGTMGKHVNTAKAAVAGILATRLAEEGFDAPRDAVGGERGFEQVQSTTFDPARAAIVMGDSFGVESVFFKRYACCHGTHSAVEGVREIRSHRPFRSDEVASVVLEVGDGLMDLAGIPEPSTGLEGKFSVRYVTARALAGADLGVAGFTDAEVAREDIARLRDLVTVMPIPGELSDLPSRVTITFTDGSVHDATVDALEPSLAARLPQQHADLVEKFLRLVGPILGSDAAGRIVDEIEMLDGVDDIRTLTELTVPR